MASEPVRKRSVPRILLALAFLAFIVGYLVITMDMGDEARRAPLVIGVPTVLLAGLNVVREFRNPQGPEGAETATLDERVREVARPDDEDATADEGQALEEHQGPTAVPTDRPTDSAATAAESVPPSPTRSYVWLLAFTILYAGLGQVIGFVVATVAFLRFEGQRPWWLATIFAVLMTAAVWLFFSEILGVQHYRGLLGSPI